MEIESDKKITLELKVIALDGKRLGNKGHKCFLVEKWRVLFAGFVIR